MNDYAPPSTRPIFDLNPNADPLDQAAGQRPPSLEEIYRRDPDARRHVEAFSQTLGQRVADPAWRQANVEAALLRQADRNAEVAELVLRDRTEDLPAKRQAYLERMRAQRKTTQEQLAALAARYAPGGPGTPPDAA